jgi:glycosyltransferase involved in cell wall biosynthesis
MAYYQSSDVLLFPSHSDGFGMVQVEAQGWALPIIASRHCGQVVRDGQTGLMLPEVTAAAVAAALRRALDSPEWLDRWSRAMRTAPAPGLAALASGLTNLEPR